MIYKKPQKPLPEDFALNHARIKKIERISGWIRGLVSMLPGGLLLFNFSIVDPITCVVVLFVLSPLVYVIVEQLVVTLWSITKPTYLFWHSNYQQYKGYKLAKKQYEHDWIEWLRTQMSWWQALNGQRFEEEVGLLFKKRGYQVQLMGKSGDGGIDIVISKEAKEIIIQCKAHKNPIGPHVVRDLYGVLTHSKAREAWVISVSRFTKGSLDFARNKPIRLITIEDILTEKGNSAVT